MATLTDLCSHDERTHPFKYSSRNHRFSLACETLAQVLPKMAVSCMALYIVIHIAGATPYGPVHSHGFIHIAGATPYVYVNLWLQVTEAITHHPCCRDYRQDRTVNDHHGTCLASLSVVCPELGNIRAGSHTNLETYELGVIVGCMSRGPPSPQDPWDGPMAGVPCHGLLGRSMALLPSLS